MPEPVGYHTPDEPIVLPDDRATWRERLTPVGWGLLVLVVYLLIATHSSSFHECFEAEKGKSSYHQLGEGRSGLGVLARFRLHQTCVGAFTDGNKEAITALATLLIAAFTITLSIATRKLWRSAEKDLRAFGVSLQQQKRIADAQIVKMGEHVAEAARSALAMEGVDASMAKNVTKLGETVNINREIADRQKLLGELQSRPYLSVLFNKMIPQDLQTGTRFEPEMALRNDGLTPAYKVTYSIAADVLPHPISPTFDFPYPEILPSRSVSVIGRGQHKLMSAVVPKIYPLEESQQIALGIGQRIHVWGRVDYEDALHNPHFVEFSQSFAWRGPDTVIGYDTARHNDSD